MKIELKDKKIIINVYYSKEKYLKNTPGVELSDNTMGQCYYNNKQRLINIGVFDKEDSTLVHELFHCVEFINVMIGEIKDMDVLFSESNAYLIEYLFKTITKKRGKK